MQKWQRDTESFLYFRISSIISSFTESTGRSCSFICTGTVKFSVKVKITEQCFHESRVNPYAILISVKLLGYAVTTSIHVYTMPSSSL